MDQTNIRNNGHLLSANLVMTGAGALGYSFSSLRLSSKCTVREMHHLMLLVFHCYWPTTLGSLLFSKFRPLIIPSCTFHSCTHNNICNIIIPIMRNKIKLLQVFRFQYFFASLLFFFLRILYLRFLKRVWSFVSSLFSIYCFSIFLIKAGSEI